VAKLSHHYDFSGAIAGWVGKLVNLIGLFHTRNSFNGEIPDFINLQQLTKLELSSNKFIGAIPTTLGSCQELGTIRMGRIFCQEAFQHLWAILAA
jgi:hypothetical protein